MNIAAALLSDPKVNQSVKEAIRRELAKPRTTPRIPRQRSPLELRFLELWKLHGGPEIIEEHRFFPSRGWRFDFAHVPSLTAIECEGGLYKGGRHQTRKGMEDDADKYGFAMFLGWMVFRLTSKQIKTEWVLSLIARCNGVQRLPVAAPLFQGRAIA